MILPVKAVGNSLVMSFLLQVCMDMNLYTKNPSIHFVSEVKPMQRWPRKLPKYEALRHKIDFSSVGSTQRLAWYCSVGTFQHK